MTFHVKRRENGSMPAVGSSKNTTLESPQKAIARLSFLFIPPLKFFAYVFFLSSNATSSIADLTEASACSYDIDPYTPLTRQKN